MLILATNMSSIPMVNLGLNYLNLSGAPVTDTVTIPAKPPMSAMGVMVTGSQQASSFVSATINIGPNSYSVSYGQSLPKGLGIQVGLSQDNDASIILIADENLGGN